MKMMINICKDSNADFEENLYCKHPLLQHNPHHMQCGHYYHWHNKNYKNNKGIIGDDMGIIGDDMGII